jgi:hypothetical protein
MKFKFWQNDPNTKLPSVSLTLGLIATILLTTSGILQVLGHVNNVGPFTEMFWGAWALYFGRRFNIGGKQFTSEKAEELEKKVNE